MIQGIEALTKLTPYTSVAEESTSLAVHDSNFNNLVSSMFNKVSEVNTQYKELINTLSSSGRFTSDPQALWMLQIHIGEYSNYVSLVSTLARKGVATIETLEKSQ